MDARLGSRPRNQRHDHLVTKVVVRTVFLFSFPALIALVVASGSPAVAGPHGGSESVSSGPSHESAPSSSSGSSSSSHDSAPSSSSSSSSSSSRESAPSSSSSGSSGSSSHESGSSTNGSASSGSHGGGTSTSSSGSSGASAAPHESARGASPSGPAPGRDEPARSSRTAGEDRPAPPKPSGTSRHPAGASPHPAAPVQAKPSAQGQPPGAGGLQGKGDERNPQGRLLEPPSHRPGKPPINGPPRPPINGQPQPPAPQPPAPQPPAQSSDEEPYDPGVFYLYDNFSPESDYLVGEPCRIVCQAAPSVQCSSYSGQCQGLPDRLICDGQTFMCPGSVAPEQLDQPHQQAQADQHGERCEGRHKGRRHGHAKAGVSCSGANGVP